MNNINAEISSINTGEFISAIFVIVGLLYILGDEILKDGIRQNDELKIKQAESIFFWALLIAFIIYLVVVVRNYNFYLQKKESGEDSTNDLLRFIGSLIILTGFAIIFYTFIKDITTTEI